MQQPRTSLPREALQGRWPTTSWTLHSSHCGTALVAQGGSRQVPGHRRSVSGVVTGPHQQQLFAAQNTHPRSSRQLPHNTTSLDPHLSFGSLCKTKRMKSFICIGGSDGNQELRRRRPRMSLVHFHRFRNLKGRRMLKVQGTEQFGTRRKGLECLAARLPASPTAGHVGEQRCSGDKGEVAKNCYYAVKLYQRVASTCRSLGRVLVPQHCGLFVHEMIKK